MINIPLWKWLEMTKEGREELDKSKRPFMIDLSQAEKGEKSKVYKDEQWDYERVGEYTSAEWSE